MTTDKMSRRTVLWSSFLIFLLSATIVTTLMTSISASPPTHDIAVTKITLSYNTTVVFPTWENLINITVTVKNNGSSKETFNLTAYYYNETQWNLIQTKPVEDLAKGTEINETFTWDCRNLPGYSEDPDLAWPYPVYEIKANATLADDANPDDNELINGDVTVQWPADCDGDGYINDIDLAIINASYGHHYPDPEYDPRADFDGNGCVDSIDVSSYLSPWWHQGPLEAHDVAVLNITFSYDTTVVFPDWDSLNINVTVKNMGLVYNETFTVTAYYKLHNETQWNLIETPQNVTNLSPEAEETLTFVWDLPTWDKYPDNRREAWPYPNHTIEANASKVDKETKIDDNSYSGNVTVQWPADCDGDGYINDIDLAIINASYGHHYPDPEYDPRADFDGNGCVDSIDVFSYLSPWWHQGPLDYIDIAVTSIALSYNTTVVYTNCSLQIYVTVKNNGTQTETFDVTACYNTTAVNTTVIETKQVNLTAGNEKNVTFTWNIPNATWPYLNYTLNANATRPGDEDPINNELTDGTLTARWPGDCNGDGHVNATDLFNLTDVAKYYPYYHQCADFDGDGLVNIKDVIILADHWETGPLDS